ncbi:uncharacterized protein Dwil_GK10770 [Drosophila willistoni]|uniref:Uncharacterized protein n=2 Tax=Drosophila willistoni TaxID=7260 RepID=B4N4E4_DROWI|nr:uncharacterized protein Dwil_GK10770 [Drosophila willistoni]
MLFRVAKQSICVQSRARSTIAATNINVKVNNGHNLNDKSAQFAKQMQTEWRTARDFKELPGPSRWQMWRGFQKNGEYYHLDLFELMLHYRQLYGDIFLLPGLFGMPSNVVTFSIDSFEKIFRTEGQWPVRTGADPVLHYREKRKDGFFKDCMGLMDNGEQWARLRSAVNPILMQQRNTVLYLEPLQRVNQQFIDNIRKIRDPISLEVPGTFHNNINHLTFESVATIVLDKDIGLIRNADESPDAKKLFDNIRIFMRSFFELGMKPSLYKYISTPTYSRFSQVMDEIFDICSMYVNEAVKRIENTPKDTQKGHPSMLEQLLKIDHKFAIVMAMDMLMGGVDTTSSAIAGLLFNLAKNPEKQQKLRDEILAKLSHPDQQFTMNDMKSLPYLRACIKESLRLYPIVFGNLRATGADVVLDGYRIPKGTRIMMNSNLLLTEECYYPRAKEYLPERWLRRQEDDFTKSLIAKDLSPFIYLPFGFGPRMCAGKRIVEMEMELTVANLVRNFYIEYNYSTENAFKCQWVNMPVLPLNFKFTDVKY